MHALGLLYIIQGIKLRTFDELATCPHDMKLSIVSRGAKDLSVPEVRKDKKETKGAKEIVKSSVKESMVVNTTPLKFSKRKEEIILRLAREKKIELDLEEEVAHDKGWIVVNRCKKRKLTPTQKESHCYRNYRIGNKAQKNKRKKKTRKPKLMHEEDKDIPRPQCLVTLADFFSTRFICDHQDENLKLVTCHAINGTEEESILSRSLEEEGVSKDLSRSIKFKCSNCDIREYSLLHVYRLLRRDSRITYKLLLVRPWIHGNGVAESHFVEAKFYLKNDNSPEVISVEIPLVNREDNLQLKSLASREPHKSTGTFNSGKGEESTSTTKSMILIDEKTSNLPILYYVPISRRKKGESPFVESPKGLKVGDIEVLKESFTAPLTKITKQQIKIDLTEASLPQGQTKDGFNLKAYKLMAKVGYDFIAHTEFKSLKVHEQPELSSIQKKLLREGHVIPVSRKGLEYKSPKPIRITRKGKEKGLNRYHITIKEAQNKDITIIEELEIKTPEEDAEDVPQSLEDGGQSTVDELKEVNLGTIEEPRPTFISASLFSQEEVKYMSLLTEYRDIFACSYKEMPGLYPKVAVHHLTIKPSKHCPYQKKERAASGCVDFHDLNNTCPKDDFPLPITEIMVDATTGHEALSFTDGSSGYNQIRMTLSNEEMTAFRTPKGIYCFKVMPFGLKNVVATYQRAMQKVFDNMLHKYIECYVNDLVVKSKRRHDHLKDLKVVFERLQKHQLRMNPLKCAFGVTLEKFLGFIERSLGALLAQEKEKGKEHGLYYLSKTLVDVEVNYSLIEKMCLAFFFAINKLRHYMQAFTVHLVAKANPIKYVLSRPIIFERLAKWAVLLQQYDIVYNPQKAIKGQALAEFLAGHPIPSNWKLCEDLLDDEVFFTEVMKT
ncbi:uncharacterized protein E5676_scaffold562G00360 [Cucumis melo var. makuwa]|uniref:Reverse transcriptase domain-containing protein n=1 Tax=Cucumis melo var. makuwa TaxID=1194695 RepID=A0A5D3BMW4_CUCMM|nr:uncharacterized protein E5676_scaffold562G00360 [Cucumis melo var. makuwa]